MESRNQRISIGSVIFILMLFAAVAVIRPVYIRVGNALSSLERQLVEKAESLTGFSFSYQSLSPSILSAIGIKGIVVTDRTSGKKMAEIRHVTVAYRFGDLFSANPAYAVRSVTVNGVTVEYDMLSDKETFMRLVSVFRKDDAEQSDRAARHFDLRTFNIDLPFLVQVKNLSFHYSDVHNDVLATLKNLSLRNSFNASGITARGNGRARYFTPHLAAGGKPIVMAVNFDINGTIMPEIDGSSAMVRLSGAGNADATVSQMDVLVNYDDFVLQMRSMRSVLPYAAVARQDFRHKSFSVSGSFDHFNPYQLVRIQRAPRYIQVFSGTRLTGTASFSYADHDIAYETDLFADVTPSLLGGDVRLRAVVAGSKDYVRFGTLSTTGSVVQAQFSGDFDIKKIQPSGMLSCDYYVLPNGNALSGEVYFDPLAEGFMLFSPQLFLGDRNLSAFEATLVPRNRSIDVTASFSDYAHLDYEEAGQVTVSGSCVFEQQPYIQAQVSVHNVFLDSAALLGAFFARERQAQAITALAPSLAPYIMADPFDIYLWSDFREFTFNAPLCLVANTTKDREMLLFGANGSNQTVQLTQFDLQFGSVSANAAMTADFSSGFDNFSFFGDFVVNAVPYRFNGRYDSGWLSVAGDYDFDAMVAFGDDRFGSVRFASLPVSLGKIIGSLSTNATFSWTDTGDFTVELVQFEAEDSSGFFRANPRVACAGTLNRYGFMMHDLTYADEVSLLHGSGNVLWNMNGRMFDSVHIDLNAESTTTRERIALLADVTNPGRRAFSADAIKNDFYFTAQADLELFPLARFLGEQNADNTLSASATASGTVRDPFVSLNVRNVSAGLYGSSLVAHGNAVLDDSGVSVEGLTASWAQLKVTDARAQFNPADFSGTATIPFSGTVLNESFSVPLTVSVVGVPPVEKWRPPQYYTVSLRSASVSGGLFPAPFAFDLSLMRVPGRFDLLSQDGDGIAATWFDGGMVTARFGDDMPVQLELAGQVSPRHLDLAITDLRSDLADLASVVTIPFITISQGNVRGSLTISGMPADPEFDGALVIDNPAFAIPLVSKAVFRADRIAAAVVQSVLTVPPTKCATKTGAVYVDARVEFNRWKIGLIDLGLRTPERNYVPVDMTLPLIRYKGSVGLDDLNITLEGTDMTVSGRIEPNDADVEVVLSSLQDTLSGTDFFSLFSSRRNDDAAEGQQPSAIMVSADLGIRIGQRVQMLFNPFLRGIVVPNTMLALTFDGASGNFSLKGDVALRGGQIVWLNRNFYMKEGRIVFNETQDLIDPRVTVRAETRERDTNGSPVTITLSAVNQPVSAFTPQFSASPAKSEAEIMTLLGQVITADAESAGQFGGAAGDMLLQSVVINRIENALRETLRFDIFSIRTNFLQNVVKVNTDRNFADRRASFSNYFDNSAVYIGKYFGSSLYADALMHWTYDDTKSGDSGSVGNLVFQPEFSLEMASPFVNIRWGIAPNIEAIQNNLWVPSTSITLSWKFSF